MESETVRTERHGRDEVTSESSQFSIPDSADHSGPALHCRVPSRSERCLRSQGEGYFFVVVDCDYSYLLSVELLSCLVSTNFSGFCVCSDD